MSSARPDSWMPLYWGDYLRDTGHLGAAEHGAYLLLIGHYWTTGAPLPDDDTLLARIARMQPKEWKRARPVVVAFFQRDGNTLRQKRIDTELSRWQQIRDAKSNAGRASAAARAQQRANTCSTDDATNTPTKSNPLPLPSPSSGSKEPSERGARERAPTPPVSAVNGSVRRSTKLPENFEVPADWIAEAERKRRDLGMPSANLAAEAVLFVNHHTSKPEASLSFDWRKNWINWALKARSAPPDTGRQRREVAPL